MAERGYCDYCKLPLPRPFWSRSDTREEETPGPDEPRYCCFGCRFAAAVVHESGDEGAVRWTLTRLGLAIFFTMNVTVFTMGLWTIGIYEAEGASRMAASYQDVFRYLALLFSLPVLFLLGWPLFESAIDGLGRGIFSTDLLLSAGVLAAYGYSAASVASGHGHVYFEVGCIILVFVTLGRWLEAVGKLETTHVLDGLEKLLPTDVRRVSDGVETLVAREAVRAGDCLRVLPGERFPADGRLLAHHASVDEQVLTGESRPIDKGPGDAVFGGTLDLDGNVLIEVSASGPEAALSRLVQLVRQARESKGRYERLADRISSWFFPCIGVIASLTLAVHWRLEGLERGLLAALAVTLIACPCALGLATPMAVWTALGRAANRQVLFKSGETLERLAEIRAIRFDKTGTLTTGTPVVSAYVPDGVTDPDLIVRRAAGLALCSPHALSTAIGRFAAATVGAKAPLTARVLPGRGVQGTFGSTGAPVYLGSARLMKERAQAVSKSLRHIVRDATKRGKSIALIGWGGRVRGLFAFDETIRASANATIAWCRSSGYDTAVLTGDHSVRGLDLGRQLGLPVHADLLPEDKIAAVQQARQEIGAVAMVGDGINDAPALAASDVGVALGCGTDVSRDSAQVCLLTDDLTRLPWSLMLARRTVRIIRQNLYWSFAYNGIGVLCAAMGWLNPALAAFLMVGSSVLVIANSLRLRRPLPDEEFEQETGVQSKAEPSGPRIVESAGTSSLHVPELAAP